MWAEVDPRRTLKQCGFNLERLFIEELINMDYCTVVSQLRILQEWAPNTPEPFRAVSSSDLGRAVAW
jgi:hypothetical protein